MAVAPINKVREVLDYAVTEIPRNKIDMGIPNYGYDWPLPFERGVTKARTIGNEEAVLIAADHNAVIEYDSLSQAPYFNYISTSGGEHVVWFEDARSIEAKINLVFEYQFRGAGYWNIMKPFRQNWTVCNELADIVKL